MSSDPPFQETYKALIDQSNSAIKANTSWETCHSGLLNNAKGEYELPLIDLSKLTSGKREEDRCKEEICKASKELGFFQVINHGISPNILEQMRAEQVKAFKHPFQQKICADKFLNLSIGTYRWGTPTATTLDQLCWSEAFHIPMTDVTLSSDGAFDSLREFANTVANLAQTLSEILAEKIERKPAIFRENCQPNSCYLRLNRYPPCPLSQEIFGLMPHTDSDFLTILHQDQVGGLQIVKHGKWMAVKPNPKALVINIGDLLQAWSNNVYKSIEHRVLANPRVERYSTAYFFCPSSDTEILSSFEPSIYKKFSFREYKGQVQEDVKYLGQKIGLERFLL